MVRQSCWQPLGKREAACGQGRSEWEGGEKSSLLQPWGGEWESEELPAWWKEHWQCHVRCWDDEIFLLFLDKVKFCCSEKCWKVRSVHVCTGSWQSGNESWCLWFLVTGQPAQPKSLNCLTFDSLTTWAQGPSSLGEHIPALKFLWRAKNTLKIALSLLQMRKYNLSPPAQCFYSWIIS